MLQDRAETAVRNHAVAWMESPAAHGRPRVVILAARQCAAAMFPAADEVSASDVAPLWNCAPLAAIVQFPALVQSPMLDGSNPASGCTGKFPPFTRALNSH